MYFSSLWLQQARHGSDLVGTVSMACCLVVEPCRSTSEGVDSFCQGISEWIFKHQSRTGQGWLIAHASTTMWGPLSSLQHLHFETFRHGESAVFCKSPKDSCEEFLSICVCRHASSASFPVLTPALPVNHLKRAKRDHRQLAQATQFLCQNLPS